MEGSESSQVARRLSTDSSSSTDSASHSSTSPLILSYSPENDNSTLPDISDEDEDNEQLYDHSNSSNRSLPTLPTSTMFVFLLAPCLKLGALSLANNDLRFGYGISAILVFALLSAFSRQLFYLLSRYLRKGELEDLVVDAFARGRGKKRLRGLLAIASRLCTGLSRVLLISIYLRESLHDASSSFAKTSFWSSRVAWTVVFAACIIPFYSTPSIASKRVIYATYFSVAAYVLWLGCIAYAPFYSRRTRDSMGLFWQGITTIAFAFTMSSTLSLAALTEPIRPLSMPKRRFRSFEIASATSVALAAALLFPLPFIFCYPNKPMQLPGKALQSPIIILKVTNLLLAIPYILTTAPAIPLPVKINASTKVGISKNILFLTAICLSLVSDSGARVLSDLLLVFGLFGTYLLPAILHITTHHFRRPRSIVIPPQTSDHSNSPSRDELLQRKERELQRRRKARRIVWDIGAWVLLVPLGIGGLVWAAGKTAGHW